MSEASPEEGVLGADIEGSDVESESLPEDAPEAEEKSLESLPLDQVFGILKNQRRRYVLQYLYESEGQASLSDIAEQIAAWENGKDVRQISSSERKRVYVGLYQCHLPKMDGVDVVSFNKPRGTIELGSNADALYRYLDTDEDTEAPPWHVYSMALALAGAGVLATALLVRPMTALPVVDVAVAATIVAFLAYSAFNFSWIRTNDSDDD